MLEFKCKAKDAKTGEIVIGYFYVSNNGRQRIFDGSHFYDAVPGSVNRFIALDKNKIPVFVGDPIENLDPDGRFQVIATFRNYGAILDGKIIRRNEICD